MRASLFISIYLVVAAHATDSDREPWQWSPTIPAAVLPPNLRATVRDSQAFERFRFRERTTMRDVVLAFGAPDGFARQYPVTRADGIPVDHVHAGPEAGTFRYVLRDGGEYRITVSDFHTITCVTRCRDRGERDIIYTNK
jgi:hypothetical protein